MEDIQISLNTKLEVAVEILAAKIAITSRQSYNTDNEIKKLLKERDEMYKGNDDVIEKILREYGPEIKKRYKGE